MKIICYLKSIWRSIQVGWPFNYPCSGHSYVNEEEDIPALVTTSKCEMCGKYDISWKAWKSGREQGIY